MTNSLALCSVGTPPVVRRGLHQGGLSRLCLVALSLGCFACNESSSATVSTIGPGSSLPVAPGAVSTGVSAERVDTDQNLVALSVSEMSEGGKDLNGDGDVDDEVLFVHDAHTGVTTNLGFAVEGFEVVFPYVVFTVPEVGESSDLNGDGDLDDQILFIFDSATGSVKNQLLKVPTLSGGSIAPFVKLEHSGGLLAVLARDQDFDRITLRLIELATGATLDSGLQSFFSKFGPSSKMAVVLRELVEGADLNGDGDVVDNVMHVLDTKTGLLENLELSLTPLPIFASNDELLAFAPGEAINGNQDFDGDGLTTSTVLHVHEYATGITTNTNVSSDPGGGTFLVGGRVVFIGADGELRIWEANTGITLRTGIRPQSMNVTDSGVLCSVSESRESIDLNGDGDLKDFVLHSYDFATWVSQNLGVSASTQFGTSLFAFASAFEGNEGMDLNGDGDQTDAILYSWNAGDQLSQSSVLGFPLGSLDNYYVLTRVFESDIDLNGDGDLLDFVAFIGRPGQGAQAINLELALTLKSGLPSNFNSYLPVLVNEASQGETDLNGDGDHDDDVLFIIRLQ